MEPLRSHDPADRCEWFADTRDAGRGLRVTVHDAEGLIVVSQWRGGRCTGTFRLGLRDAGRLAGLLVDGLGRAVPTTPASPSRPGRIRRLLARVWGRPPREHAEVVRIDEHRR